MRTLSTVESSLEKLLAQSIAAMTRTGHSEHSVVAHLQAILVRLATFYRATEMVTSQVVIEPLCVPIDLEHGSILAPRLIVQCEPPAGSLCDVLTLTYVPTNATHIALRVIVRDAVHETRIGLSWSKEDGWQFALSGEEVNSETHAKFLRMAFFDIGFFSPAALTLEPI
jgi:hypothetical protein